jgi:beta-N-acetylhexosaminidase
VQRDLDPSGLPATLSPLVVKKMLRDELKFEGVTMTDDLQMQAITDHYGFREAVQQAVIAGVDLLVIGNNLEQNGDVLGKGVAAIEELLGKGAVSVESVNASLQRIAQLKGKIEGRLPWHF